MNMSPIMNCYELLQKFRYTQRFQQVTFEENMGLRMVKHSNSEEFFHKNLVYCRQSFYAH
jgi:hypothetical protein